jgi:hypothetical protein
VVVGVGGGADESSSSRVPVQATATSGTTPIATATRTPSARALVDLVPDIAISVLTVSIGHDRSAADLSCWTATIYRQNAEIVQRVTQSGGGSLRVGSQPVRRTRPLSPSIVVSIHAVMYRPSARWSAQSSTSRMSASVTRHSSLAQPPRGAGGCRQK